MCVCVCVCVCVRVRVRVCVCVVRKVDGDVHKGTLQGRAAGGQKQVINGSASHKRLNQM